VNELAEHMGLFKMFITSYKIISQHIYADMNTNAEYENGK